MVLQATLDAGRTRINFILYSLPKLTKKQIIVNSLEGRRVQNRENCMKKLSYLLPAQQWNRCREEDIALDKSRFLSKESPCTASAAENKQSFLIPCYHMAVSHRD